MSDSLPNVTTIFADHIEGARVSLTRQTRMELLPEPSVCAADVWAA